jgi:hypothetical protein
LKPAARIEDCEKMSNNTEIAQSTIDLRYMQVEISMQTGANLPGAAVTENFTMCEFITLIERTEKGLICYLRLEFDDPKVLETHQGGIEILEIKSQNSHSAFVKAIAYGPLALIFCRDEEAWWANPTHVTHNGMTMTIQGTMKGLRRIRTELAALIGNGFSVKLGTESLQRPEFIDLLPKKQRLVLEKAIKMGYYSRPRGCTQRDIAQVMDIKQATVSEHLQSAEAKIIHSIGN